MASYRKVLCFLAFLCMAAVNADIEKKIAQDDEKEISQEDKLQCVKKFLDWCNNMQYPQKGENSSLALLSISYRDDANFYRVFCSSDSEGTNCTRNLSPWFSCTPDHNLSYKGEVLTETSADVDGDICKTQEKASKELFLHNNASYNSTESVIEKELKSLFEEMRVMFQQIHELQKRLGDTTSMGNFRKGFWKGFHGLLFGDNENTKTVSPNEKKESIQIEKE
uniref:U9-Saltitoxin-Pre1a_1 n=1 Tax=Phidippus regius TaxID=1905328 RepID=A0A482Z560_9ARAC